MPITLDLSAEQHERLTAHLQDNDAEVEQVAFAFCDIEETPANLRFAAKELYLVPSNDLDVQESYHISLTDDGLARIIKSAWDKRLALAEFHSHLDFGFRTRFSPSDIYGLNEFVPHVRWRLKGMPYVAIVLGTSEFDALAWRSPLPERLDSLLVDGVSLIPTNLTIDALEQEMYLDA